MGKDKKERDESILFHVGAAGGVALKRLGVGHALNGFVSTFVARKKKPSVAKEIFEAVWPTISMLMGAKLASAAQHVGHAHAEPGDEGEQTTQGAAAPAETPRGPAPSQAEVQAHASALARAAMPPPPPGPVLRVPPAVAARRAAMMRANAGYEPCFERSEPSGLSAVLAMLAHRALPSVRARFGALGAPITIERAEVFTLLHLSDGGAIFTRAHATDEGVVVAQIAMSGGDGVASPASDPKALAQGFEAVTDAETRPYAISPDPPDGLSERVIARIIDAPPPDAS